MAVSDRRAEHADRIVADKVAMVSWNRSGALGWWARGSDDNRKSAGGLFLERSYRMHPDVCRYISDAFYESRLEPAEGCERQATSLGTGLRFLPVEHEGNRRSSAEEAARVREEFERLLGQEWTDAEGVTRLQRIARSVAFGIDAVVDPQHLVTPDTDVRHQPAS